MQLPCQVAISYKLLSPVEDAAHGRNRCPYLVGPAARIAASWAALIFTLEHWSLVGLDDRFDSHSGVRLRSEANKDLKVGRGELSLMVLHVGACLQRGGD